MNVKTCAKYLNFVDSNAPFQCGKDSLSVTVSQIIKVLGWLVFKSKSIISK